MMARTMAAGLGAIALAACAMQAAPPAPANSTEASGDPAPPPSDGAQPPADSTQPPASGATTNQKCDPTNIQQFVGKERSAALEQQMLKVSGAATVRWAPFGTAVTMEFRYDRLTAFLDEQNRISRISCS